MNGWVHRKYLSKSFETLRCIEKHVQGRSSTSKRNNTDLKVHRKPLPGHPGCIENARRDLLGASKNSAKPPQPLQCIENL